MKPTYEELAVQLANAESKCRELAAVVAENVAMKEFLHSRVEESICGKLVKTPATDAFLAEVRAQGAEEVSAICRGLANRDGCSVNMRCSYNLTAERAEAVAAQLRKGGAHHCSHCGGIDTCSEHGCTATDQMIERYRASKGAAL
ncbi:MAG: hypothetical protein RR068_01245 [Hafnia sp.]